MADQPNTNTTHLDGTLTVRIASWLDLPRSLFPLGISVIFKTGIPIAFAEDLLPTNMRLLRVFTLCGFACHQAESRIAAHHSHKHTLPKLSDEGTKPNKVLP